jgi:hypothetical protein
VVSHKDPAEQANTRNLFYFENLVLAVLFDFAHFQGDGAACRPLADKKLGSAPNEIPSVSLGMTI